NVHFNPLERRAELFKPLQFRQLVGCRQRRGLEFAVDPLLIDGVVRTSGCGNRNGSRDQRGRAGHGQKALLGQGTVSSSQASHVGSSGCSDKTKLRPGLIPDLLFFAVQTVRKIATAETSEITVASHRLEISTPSPIGNVAIGSMPTKAIHNRWMTAASTSEMNSRSPRVVGMRSTPTRSASG